MLEARPLARGAAPEAVVEAEVADADAVRLRGGRRGEERADGVERPDVARGRRARALADRRLVDELDPGEPLRALDAAACAGFRRGDAERAADGGEEHVADERRLARARDARHDRERAEREGDVDVLEVVLGGAEKAE